MYIYIINKAVCVKLLIYITFILLSYEIIYSYIGNVEVIKDFTEQKGLYGTATVNNIDGNLSIVEDNFLESNRLKYAYNESFISNIPNNIVLSYSGHNYRIFTNSNQIIINNKGGFINKIPLYEIGFLSYEWTYDDKCIYYFDSNYNLKRFNIYTGKTDYILKNKLLWTPRTVLNTNILYLLKNIPDIKDSDYGKIVRLNLKTKKYEELSIPENDGIHWSYTISPNEKVVLYCGYETKGVVVQDLRTRKIIDVIPMPKNTDEPLSYSWRIDSSYVVFTFGGKVIVKYTLPKEYWDIDTNDYINSNETMVETLRKEGYALYKQKKDQEAVKKYEEALKYGENAQLWYDYANSLSNLKDRLEESFKAYRKAIELGFDKKNLAYYNLACVYSRLKKIPEAYEYLSKALESGYNSYSHIEKDSDLENLRADKNWKKWWVENKK